MEEAESFASCCMGLNLSRVYDEIKLQGYYRGCAYHDLMRDNYDLPWHSGDVFVTSSPHGERRQETYEERRRDIG